MLLSSHYSFIFNRRFLPRMSLRMYADLLTFYSASLTPSALKLPLIHIAVCIGVLLGFTLTWATVEAYLLIVSNILKLLDLLFSISTLNYDSSKIPNKLKMFLILFWKPPTSKTYFFSFAIVFWYQFFFITQTFFT